MTNPTATRIDPRDIVWPAPVAIAQDRLIRGTPQASTVILEDESTHQLGLWQVSPGEFTTDHVGYTEYIHIISGSGALISDDREVTPLIPGVSVLMHSGWKGRWVVNDAIVKAYTTITTHP